MSSGQLRLIETAGHFKGLEPFVKQFKDAGAFVIHKCTQVRHAKAAERLGVDMISMDGFDCAGHPGEADVGNWVLFPKAARELSIPFVASGGYDRSTKEFLFLSDDFFLHLSSTA